MVGNKTLNEIEKEVKDLKKDFNKLNGLVNVLHYEVKRYEKQSKAEHINVEAINEPSSPRGANGIEAEEIFKNLQERMRIESGVQTSLECKFATKEELKELKELKELIGQIMSNEMSSKERQDKYTAYLKKEPINNINNNVEPPNKWKPILRYENINKNFAITFMHIESGKTLLERLEAIRDYNSSEYTIEFKVRDNVNSFTIRNINDHNCRFTSIDFSGNDFEMLFNTSALIKTLTDSRYDELFNIKDILTNLNFDKTLRK